MRVSTAFNRLLALEGVRHLDLAAGRCFMEYELRRVRCPDCGVRIEAVLWARPRARHTRDFEDLVAFLAQQMAKEPICRLCGSAGTPSARSLSALSPTTSTQTGSPGW